MEEGPLGAGCHYLPEKVLILSLFEVACQEEYQNRDFFVQLLVPHRTMVECLCRVTWLHEILGCAIQDLKRPLQ